MSEPVVPLWAEGSPGIQPPIPSDILSANEAIHQLQRDASTKLRSIRNAILNDTDKYLMWDYPIDNFKRDEWKKYRQTLRDITANFHTLGEDGKLKSLCLDEDGQYTFELEDYVWPTPPQ